MGSSKRRLSPEDLEKIATLWLKGWTIQDIAKAIHCHKNTISRQVAKLRKLWNQEISILPAEIVAELRHLKAEAWKLGLKNPGTQRLIAWCIEQEARIAGIYQQPKDTISTEIRVAGHSPEEMRQILIERVQRLIGPTDN